MTALGRRLRRLPVGLAGVIALLGVLYLAVHVLHPFYRAWGLDGAAVHGTLRIGAGDRPVPAPWPGFGMYLVLSWATWLAHGLGHVSFLRWSDVAGAADPLPGVLELAGFLRLLSVGAVLAVALGVHGALRLPLRRLGDRGRLSMRVLTAGLLLAVGLQEGLLYHASMVRPELYGILFWVLGLAAAAWAAGRTEGRAGVGGFVIAGGFLALAHLTDPSMLGLVAWAPAFLWVCREAGWTWSAALRSVPAESRWPLVPAGAPAVAMLALIAAAWLRSGRAGVPNAAAALLLVLLAAPALPVVLARCRLRAAEGAAAGVLLGYLLHFALYRSPARSWEHLLGDVQSLFFGPIQTVQGPATTSAGVAPIPMLLLAGLGLTGWTLWRATRRGERGLAAAVATAVVLLIVATGGAAAGPWDLARQSVPLLLWNLALGIHLLERRVAPRWLGVPACLLAGLLFIPVLDQAHRAWKVGDRLDPTLGNRLFRMQAWIDPGALAPEERYALALGERFDPGAGEGRLRITARHAMLWRQIRRDVGQAVVNQTADLRHVGALAGDFAIPGRPDRRVMEEPEDLTAAVTWRPVRWSPEPLRAASGRADAAGSPLRLADRSGLRVFYFADETLLSTGPTPEGLLPTRLRVTVRTDEGVRRYRGYRVAGSADVPVMDPAWGDGFVVLQERRGEDLTPFLE